MARKRKSDTTPLDEVDRTLYSTFCSAANSLSHLYTQAMNHQKVAFQAGERQALEKLYLWIIRQHEEGSRVTAADIAAHIEKEIDYGGEDPAISSRLHFQPFPQPAPHFPNSSISTNTAASLGQPVHGASRANHSEQAKNSVFSNALSSPVRRSLQPYQLAQAGGPCYQTTVQPSGDTRIGELHSSNDGNGGESNSPSHNDSSMEMH